MNDTVADKLTIVGVGSSAGGLEAISELVANLPANIDVSFVVVQHMAPTFKSLMTELVARQTELLVEDVVDNTVPQSNVIYVTPPNTDVIFSNGKLQLVSPSDKPAHSKPSVDRFLVSLAEAHGDKSMAIILSGTGSDGAYGIQAIREVGGITIAQDTESAKYDGMPQSAIQTGCVDLILRPSDIGTHLQKILTSPRDFREFRKGALKDKPLSDLMHILLARTRVDFRDYKQTTIGRRIGRRMVALGIETEEEYTQFCRNNPSAVDALFKDLLISVTRFFRDPEVFKQLEELLPQLIEESGDDPLRIWIAGCATGEEAYSIAMLLAEAMGGPQGTLKNRVQIFATDIDSDALQIGRVGIYNSSALNDIPRDLSEKYMIHVNDGVQVVENLRRIVIFSEHNVFQDPPFQRVHLICCRNLLIYFGNSLQQRVMSRFHYSMNTESILFLGSAESVAGSDELFISQRGTSHIFRKRGLKQNKSLVYNMPNIPSFQTKPKSIRGDNKTPSVDRQFFEALAQSLGKNSLLVSDDYSIARVYGNISPFIEVSENSNLRMHLDLLKSPLREEARSLIAIAIKNEEHRSGLRHLLSKNDQEEIQLNIFPIIAKNINERAALVVFTPIKKDIKFATQDAVALADDDDISKYIRDLENEVASIREVLQQTTEELETSNEELQSLNEELQSTNEELQATNEELETSNEELQSTNEELITVNEELQVTTSELSGRTGELTSVLQSTPLAILVLDSALQVTQATKAASELFQISRPIVSPHVSQCALPEGYPSLAPICSEVLKLGQTETLEFSASGNLVRISCSPYFDLNGQILGLTMVVTEFPSLAREMEMILNSPHIFLMHRAVDGEILRISRGFSDFLGTTRSAANGKNIKDFMQLGLASELGRIDRDFLLGEEMSQISEYAIIPPNSKFKRRLSVNRFKFDQGNHQKQTIYTIATDITETLNSKNETHELTSNMEKLQDSAGIGFWSVDLTSDTVHWSRKVFDIHGVNPTQGSPTLENAINYYHPDDVIEVKSKVTTVLENGGEFHYTKRLFRQDGTEINVQSHGLAIQDSSGQVIKLIGIFQELD